MSFDGAIGVYSVLASNLAATQFTATDLTAGSTYTFKVESRNAYGYSEFSDTKPILCATHPETPTAPTTTVIGDEVVFEWSAPVDNGTPITSYKIYIRKSDLLFIIDETLCDGSVYDVLANTQCVVKLTELAAIPFSLLLGVSIQI